MEFGEVWSSPSHFQVKTSSIVATCTCKQFYVFVQELGFDRKESFSHVYGTEGSLCNIQKPLSLSCRLID